MTPEQRLKRDVQDLKIRYRHLTERTGGDTDSSRMLVVLSVAADAAKHLPRSLPRLIEQTRARGRAVDILIGCNDGFESEALFEYLDQCCGFRAIHVYCTKTKPNRPAKIVDGRGEAITLTNVKDSPDRCYVVHQRSDPPNVGAGKIRMLGDLYGWIDDSIAAGWRPPSLLLACDAESEFIGIEPWSSQGAEEPRFGILLDRLERDDALQFVGARNRFVAFEEDESGVRQPRFDAPLHALQLYLNLVHARAVGFTWMPGGGTLGRTEAMTAMLGTIAAHYPSALSEDTATSILAATAGFAAAAEFRVAVVNRCAPASEADAARGQMDRWITGSKDLEDMYGRKTTRNIARPTLVTIFVSGTRLIVTELLAARSMRARWGVLVFTVQMIAVLPDYLRLVRAASRHRSEDPDFPATW